MPNDDRRFLLGGVWRKQTAIGPVLSGRFARARLEEAARMGDVWGCSQLEIVLFPNNEKRTERSPDFTAYVTPSRPRNEVDG